MVLTRHNDLDSLEGELEDLLDIVKVKINKGVTKTETGYY